MCKMTGLRTGEHRCSDRIFDRRPGREQRQHSIDVAGLERIIVALGEGMQLVFRVRTAGGCGSSGDAGDAGGLRLEGLDVAAIQVAERCNKHRPVHAGEGSLLDVALHRSARRDKRGRGGRDICRGDSDA